MTRYIVVKCNNDGTVIIKEEDYKYLIDRVKEYNKLVNSIIRAINNINHYVNEFEEKKQ